MVEIVIFSDVNGVLGFGRYGGAYRVATELRNAGFSVQVVEFFADLTMEELKMVADKFIGRQTLFVGFATTLMIKKTGGAVSRIERTKQVKHSGHLPQDDEFVQEMFALFRAKNPNIKIVVGGGKSHITSLEGVDYWVWGYADDSVVALAKHLKENAPLVTQPGRTGKVIASAQAYPFRNYSKSRIVWHNDDLLFDSEHVPIEIDRGCIFRCTFCANQYFKNKGELWKDRDNLRDELRENYDRFGITGYMFADDTANDSPEKVLSLDKVFESLPFDIEWTGYGRVDVIHRHREQRELLRKSGLRALLFGIETFHPLAGKGVGKGLNPNLVKDTLYYLAETWKGEITTTASFIVGLPGETEESVWETVEWLKRDDCPIDNAIFSALNIRAVTDDPDAPLSMIAKNPTAHGYEVVGPKPGVGSVGPYWKNEHMDKTRAEVIVAEILRDHLKKPPIGDWAVYSRLRSLGYTHEKIANRDMSDASFLEDAKERWARMRRQYVSALLN